MNPLLAQLTKMLEKVDDAAWEQAPLVFRDLLIAGAIQGALVLVLGIAGIVFAVWLFRCFQKSKDPDTRFAGAMVSVFTLIPFGYGIYTILIIWLAPRAYLVSLLQ